MAELDLEKLSAGDVYRLLISTILPRPIAWVSTISKKGQPNLAPFSFFNGVCSNPPALLFCPVNHPDGSEKDTLRNIRATKQFVVNVATEALAQKMNQTSADYPPEVNEFAAAGLTEAPSVRVKPPRVNESPVNFECELLKIVKVGKGGAGSGHVVIGRVLHLHLDDEVYANGRVLVDKLAPIARLAGTTYCPVREVFEMPRPPRPAEAPPR